ncbi:hypothetical protein ACJX0J_035140, partial [Zea mays]
ILILYIHVATQAFIPTPTLFSQHKGQLEDAVDMKWSQRPSLLNIGLYGPTAVANNNIPILSSKFPVIDIKLAPLAVTFFQKKLFWLTHNVPIRENETVAIALLVMAIVGFFFLSDVRFIHHMIEFDFYIYFILNYNKILNLKIKNAQK